MSSALRPTRFRLLCGIALILVIGPAWGAETSPGLPQTGKAAPSPKASDSPDSSLLEDLGAADFRAAATASREKRAEAATAFALAQKYESEGELETARKYYQAALDADPDYTPITVRIAFLLFRQQKVAEGIKLLEDRLNKSAPDASLYSILAHGYFTQQDNGKAEKYALEALKLDSSLISNYQVLANCYNEERHPEKIEPLFEQALKTESKDPFLFLRLGDLWNVLLAEGRYSGVPKRVLPFYLKARELAPGNALINFRAGDAALLAGDAARAVEALKAAYQDNRRIPQLRERLALAYLNLHRENEAIAVLEELVADEPERSSIYPVLAELYERQGDLEKAEKNYILHLDLGSAEADDFIHVAQIQLRANRPDDALKILKRGIKNFPSLPQWPMLQAFAWRLKENFSEALKALQQAELLAQDDPDFLNSNFYFEYAATYEEAGNFEEAQRLLQKVMAMDSNHHAAMNYLGYMWADRNINLPEAEKLILRALQFDSDNAAYLDSLGWVCYRQGRHPEAKIYLGKALAQIPDDPVINDHYGDVLDKLGDTANAVTYWEKALKKSKTPDLIRAKLQKAGKKTA